MSTTDPNATNAGYLRPVVVGPERDSTNNDLADPPVTNQSARDKSDLETESAGINNATVAGYNGAAALAGDENAVDQAIAVEEIPSGESDCLTDYSTDESDPMVGTRVGKFRIDSVIASGGMGTVYKAMQLEPVQRPVALKMIRSGMADDATVNRFLVERQTLALMDHPDIACVYEAGTTSQGNPFFAMEYCDGQPIDQFCNDRNLGIRQRVELVIRIARALQRAHAHGVVHRDLKPGNILVSECEGRPNVKVIDFGIAKITDDQHAGASLANNEHATRIGEMIGTPAYMSPEQAAGATIDARTDVFAIGAILFKLLTGTTPLPELPDDCDSLAKIILHIQSYQPVPPTKRLADTTLVDASQQSQRLGFTKQSQLTAAIKGDLNWITLRAIDPDKLRRYATADDLADDLERFLSNEPVVAAAPSRLYRMRKFYQRRRAPVLAAAAISLTLILTASWATVDWLQKESVRKAETAQVQREVEQLLGRAESARIRAGKGGANAADEFADASNAIAISQSLLKKQPTLSALQTRLDSAQQQINADQAALAFVRQLDDARERATHVDPTNHDDAFGRTAGLNRLIDSFRSFGITPIETPAPQAAEALKQCPPSTQKKLTESLDFLLNEEPIGVGLYLHHQNGQITVAEVVEGGAAHSNGQIRKGDRLLSVGDIDLAEIPADQILVRAYQELTPAPDTPVSIRYVHDVEQPAVCELTSRGAAAYWARDVLQLLDPDPWRMQLRDAVLSSNPGELKRLALSPEMTQQPPFSLIQLSGTLFNLDRSNESIRILEIAQQRHPANFWANHYLGTALASAHQPPKPQESLRYLTAAVSLRPKSLGARMNLVAGLDLAGDHAGALDHAKVAAQLAAGYSPIQQLLETLTRKVDAENRDRKLAAKLSRPTSTNPNSIRQQDFNETEIADISTAPRVTDRSQSENDQTEDAKTPPADTLTETIDQMEARARALAASGNRDAAMAIVAASRDRFDDDPRVRRLKGVVLLELQDYVAARVVLSDAARRLPGDAASRFYHGVALQYSGNSKDAIHEYQAALQLRPDYAAVHEFLDPLLAEQNQ